MKKDKKFLRDLENNLGNIRDKKKKEIVSKYEKIINEEKAKKRKITEIIKEIGDPKEIAEKELKSIKKNGFFSKIGKSIKKVFSGKKKNKKDDIVKKEIKRINKEIREEDRKERKEKRKDRLNNIKKKIKSFSLFITKDIKINREERKARKEKRRKEKELQENIAILNEPVTDVEDAVSDSIEVVSEKKIFETKKERNRRILLKTLGIILMVILLFILLWVSVIFIASLFAYLDGIRFLGINIALFGLDALLLWIVIMVNRAVFRKKSSPKINLIVSIVFIFIIALGIVLSIRQISKIKTVKDVSVKYSMTTKLSNYNLPNDINQRFTITFNSNYKTQYVMNYDDNIKDKIKVEVKYYECYYDYYVKETSNSSYISLKLDDRDRLSVYIDDLKEGLVFDNDELSRYVVRITINPDDVGRLVIND